MRQCFSYTVPQTRKVHSYSFRVQGSALRYPFTYAQAVTRGRTIYSFRVQGSALRYPFTYAQASVRGRVSYKLRPQRITPRYRFSHTLPDGRGRYRFRCRLFGEILREMPPPGFMMPVHEALYGKFNARLAPNDREVSAAKPAHYLGPEPRMSDAYNTIGGIQATLRKVYSADNSVGLREAETAHVHNAIFDALDHTSSREFLSALTASAIALSAFDQKGAVWDSVPPPLEPYDDRVIIRSGGAELESVVPDAFVTSAEEMYEPADLREGSFSAEPPPLEGEGAKDADAKLNSAISLSPDRQTEAEHMPHSDGKLERLTEREISVAVLFMLCREIFMQGITETGLAGVRLKTIDGSREMAEIGFAKTFKDSNRENVQKQTEKTGKDILPEKLLAQLEKLIYKNIVTAHEQAAEPVPHKSALIEALLKTLEKYEKTGTVTPGSTGLLREPERAALSEQITRDLNRFAEHSAHDFEKIYMAVREYMQAAESISSEHTAGKTRQFEFFSEKTVLLTAARLKNVIKLAEKLLTASRMGLVDLENGRELALLGRLWFIRGGGECDRIILPAHDFDYSGSPIVFEGFDDLIPKNYSVVYPETLRRGVSEHPIPEGAELARREMPVAISVMTELISVLILMWSRFYRAFWGWTGVQAVLGITHEAYAWLTLESSREEQDERGSREHYDRCYRWLRWESEKIAISARNDMELRGNFYVGLLIEELIGYMTDHHFDVMWIFEDVEKMDQWRGLFGRDAESDLVWTLDKVKGIRHKIITNKTKGRENV